MLTATVPQGDAPNWARITSEVTAWAHHVSRLNAVVRNSRGVPVDCYLRPLR